MVSFGFIARVFAAFAIALSLSSASLAETSPRPAVPEKAGPAFRLVDQNGRAVDQSTLAGKPSVVHFGFTHCPVVCPTTMFELAERMRDLGPLADHVHFVFVTVDPERDTSALLKEYLASFDGRIIGLTGAPDQIKALADGLGATYSRQPDAAGNPTFDHSVFGFLMGRGWSKAGVLYMGSNARTDRVLAQLRGLATQVSKAPVDQRDHALEKASRGRRAAGTQEEK